MDEESTRQEASATWQPDRLLRWLLIWTALTTVVFWLPTIRAPFDGITYEWGLFGFRGKGLAGAYWLPLTGSAAALLLQWLGWRGARPPFHVLLIAWHAFLAVSIAVSAAMAPESMRLRGDTLGIDVSLAVIGPLLFTLWLVLAAYWTVRDVRSDVRAVVLPWARRNTYWLVALLALLPVQFVLLRSGEPQSLRDQIGVLITMAQWLLFGQAFRSPRGAYPVGSSVRQRRLDTQ